MGSNLAVLATIAKIVINQIAFDLNQKHEIQTDLVGDRNPLRTSKGVAREDSVLAFMSPYFSLVAVFFTLGIFGLVYEMFLDEFLNYANQYKVDREFSTISFLFAFACFGAFTVRTFLREIIVENKTIRIARAKAVVISGLSFLFFTLLFVFFQDFDLKFNLVKGLTLSFCLGVLFYLLYGRVLKFNFLKKIK